MQLLAKQKKTLEIQRGLFLIKYESADDDANPPRVMISADPSGANRVILPPDAGEAVLWSPGGCLVVRAMQPGSVEVAVAPAQPNGSIGAKIQVMPLSNDPGGKAEWQAAAAGLNLSRFQILGHVAGIGDVVVGPGEWIAGPAAPSRIEGITLQWPNRPRNIELHYAVRVGGQRPTPTQMVEAGTFVGTRGRALPLVGATLEISGPASARHQLTVDAVFLGSPQMKVSGQRVVVSGPTGREPLVGLRVGIGAIEQPKRLRRAEQEAPARLGREILEHGARRLRL